MATDCTPQVRITRSLVAYGVLAGPFYVLLSVVHGLLSPGFSFARDSWSLLALGPHGWLHVVVLVATGLMVGAAGVGVRRHGLGVAGVALVVYGALLVVAGFAEPDAPGGGATAHGLVHLAAGGLGFVAFAVAAFATARRLGRAGHRGWTLFSVAAGALLLVGFVALASGSTSAPAILGFTATVVLSWAWLAAVSLRFWREAGERGRSHAADPRSPALA